MLINESGAVKAIKDAYKGDGYTVYNHGDAVSIITEDWYIKCDWRILPRKVLALVVEHMGTIPKEREPVHVNKDDDVQMAFRGTVEGDISGWCEGETEFDATYVPVSVRGLQLYQEPEGGRCWAVDPLHLGIVERETAKKIKGRVMDEDRLAWTTYEHGQEAVVLAALRRSTGYDETEWARAIWSALEAIDLHPGEG